MSILENLKELFVKKMKKVTQSIMMRKKNESNQNLTQTFFAILIGK